jgi:hypothetical protein
MSILFQPDVEFTQAVTTFFQSKLHVPSTVLEDIHHLSAPVGRKEGDEELVTIGDNGKNRYRRRPEEIFLAYEVRRKVYGVRPFPEINVAGPTRADRLSREDLIVRDKLGHDLAQTVEP